MPRTRAKETGVYSRRLGKAVILFLAVDCSNKRGLGMVMICSAGVSSVAMDKQSEARAAT